MMVRKLKMFSLCWHIGSKLLHRIQPISTYPTLFNFQDVEVVYRSNNFIVVNKVYDLKTNSDIENEDTVAERLTHKYPELVDESLGHNFRFAHRLDYATSGILCVALNRRAARWAANAFARHRTTKHYLALVRGHVEGWTNNETTVGIGIGEDRQDANVYKSCTEDKLHCIKPRSACTKLVVLEYGEYDGKPATKLLLIPHTGRTHQLRVHCAYVGHLIVGDFTYSNREDTEPYRMMLHAYRLGIDMTREPLDITTEDPFVTSVDPLWKPTQVVQSYQQYVTLMEEKDSKA